MDLPIHVYIEKMDAVARIENIITIDKPSPNDFICDLGFRDIRALKTGLLVQFGVL